MKRMTNGQDMLTKCLGAVSGDGEAWRCRLGTFPGRTRRGGVLEPCLYLPGKHPVLGAGLRPGAEHRT